MKILVCGGRDFADWNAARDALDALRESARALGGDVAAVVHGAARGADLLGARWARERGVAEEAYPADWDRHRRRAGFLRNEAMLRGARPAMVVAFPGGAGTAHMVALARRAGVEVWEPLRDGGGADA